MMPFLIVTVVIASVLILVKMTLDYNQAKHLEGSNSADESSLKTSELRKLIKEAVAEEVHPLSEQVDRLETRMLPEAVREAGDESTSAESADDSEDRS